MRSFTRFLLVALCLIPCGGAHAVVATTAGNNLTAYNGNAAARDNNNWNNLMNNRTTPATADFGNCNALILRCAQPKCANGGCTSMDVAQSIVTGCVQSNATCKKYGNDLVQYISAQLVASSTAKANETAAAAQTAAAQAAAAQSAQQLEQMQLQMQQMQSQMAAQNEATVAQLQSALEEQKQLTAQAIADASAAQAAATATQNVYVDSNAPLAIDGLTSTQIAAASRGVSDEVLAREQITGQIMSKIEGAEVALKSLKASMLDTFTYAGCDTRGNDCSGPKRVSAFKRRAMEFFDPYETILDELEDALIQAQAVGVDITDIYMMLSGSCNVWGQYLCNNNDGTGRYCSDNCRNGKSISYPGDASCGGTRGGHECTLGQAIPVEDSPSCTLLKTLTDAESDKVRREWLEPETGDDTMIRVGCASSALQTSAFFRGRKKQASIDIETLKNIIAQDAPQSYGSAWGTKRNPLQDGVKYCAVGANMYADLQKIVSTKSLPATVCVKETRLNQIQANEDYLIQGDTDAARVASISRKCVEWNNLKCSGNSNCTSFEHCVCDSADGTHWQSNACTCDSGTWDAANFVCSGSNGTTALGGGTSGTQAASSSAGNLVNECQQTGGKVSLSTSDCLCGTNSHYNPKIQKCSNGVPTNKFGLNIPSLLGAS